MRFILLLLLFAWHPGYAHTPNSYPKEGKFLVLKPVLNMYEECSEGSSYVSQAIYGHQIAMIEKVDKLWVKVETEDGCQGFSLREGLIEDDPRWRTSERLRKIASIAGMVYPIADTEKPALLRLPFGARIELLEDETSNEKRWLKVKLVNGVIGWIQRGDIKEFKVLSLDEVVSLSHQFLELPYIWDGTSSEGYDCSGFIQTLCKERGRLLPRYSWQQASSNQVECVEFNDLQSGDLIFFGDEQISHIGMSLGEDKFIHSGVKDHKPKINIALLSKSSYFPITARRLKEVSFNPSISEIKEKLGSSWREDNPVPLKDLRLVQFNHFGFDGCVHKGKLIVHQKVAEEVVEIFRDIFDAKYPIEKMLLMDAYGADDDLACEDNNSSSFCSRPITGIDHKWSLHSYGLAIDINTLLNPYHKKNVIVPKNGEPFLDRSLDCRGMVKKGDPCHKAFVSRGWKWGGSWKERLGYVDYQHFYKEIFTD